MEVSRMRRGDMWSVLLKASIPITLSVAGFMVYVFVRGRKRRDAALENFQGISENLMEDEQEAIVRHQEEEFDSMNVSGFEGPYDPGEMIIQIIQCFYNQPRIEEEILTLQHRLSILLEKEQKMETMFISLYELKNICNKLNFEMNRFESLYRKIETLQAERSNSEAFVEDYVEAMKKLNGMKSKLNLLERKTKKLSKIKKEYLHLLQYSASALQEKEAVSSRNKEEIKRLMEEKKELESRNTELHRKIRQIVRKKQELSDTDDKDGAIKRKEVSRKPKLISALKKWMKGKDKCKRMCVSDSHESSRDEV